MSDDNDTSALPVSQSDSQRQDVEILNLDSPEYDIISKHDDLMSPLSEGEQYSEPSPSPPQNEIPLTKTFKSVKQLDKFSSSVSLSPSDGEMIDTPPLNVVTKHSSNRIHTQRPIHTNSLYKEGSADNNLTSNLSGNTSPIEIMDSTYETMIGLSINYLLLHFSYKGLLSILFRANTIYLLACLKSSSFSLKFYL